MAGYSHMYGLFDSDGSDIPSNIQNSITFPQYNNSKIINATVNLSTTTSLPNLVLPYPLHTADPMLLASTDLCGQNLEWMLQNSHTQVFQQMWSNFYMTFYQLNIDGFFLEDYPSFHAFADELICDYYANKTLPGGFDWDSDIVKNITFLFAWFNTYVHQGTPQQNQVLSTTLINFIKSNIDSVIAGSTET